MFARLASLPGGVTVLALTAVMGLDTSDQSSIGATAPEVRAAFHIGQTQIGVLATSSTLVGVLFTLPFGILADRRNRVRLLRATVLIWTVATLAVGSAPDFAIMLAAHSVLGLVTGAAGPLIASLVGDLVSAEQRGRVYSALLVGELAGSALGLALSGEIAALAGWRPAYWLLAIAGVLVLTLLTRAVEPDRSAPRTARGDRLAELNLWQALRLLVGIRTNLLLGAANPALDASRIDIVPSRLLGRAEALRTALRDSADAAAPLAFGALGARIGLRQTFVAMTASLGLAFVLGLLSMSSYRRDVLAAGNTATTATAIVD